MFTTHKIARSVGRQISRPYGADWVQRRSFYKDGAPGRSFLQPGKRVRMSNRDLRQTIRPDRARLRLG